jgi:hypothetical protein
MLAMATDRVVSTLTGSNTQSREYALVQSLRARKPRPWIELCRGPHRSFFSRQSASQFREARPLSVSPSGQRTASSCISGAICASEGKAVGLILPPGATPR